MKNSILLVSIFILASCGSAPTKDKADKPMSVTSDAAISDTPDSDAKADASGDAKDSGTAKDSGDATLKDSAKTNAVSPPPAPKTLPAENYTQLSRAVQSKSEIMVLEWVGKNLGQNPGDVRTWNALGAYYLSTHRPQMARIALRKGLDFDKTAAALYNNIGLSYIDENDIPRAVDSFRQALNADPNNVFAAANLGTLALQFGNFPRAKELLEKAYAQNSKSDSIGFNYARASTEVSDFDASVKVLDSMVNAKSRNPLVYFLYGSTLALQKKDIPKAKQILNKVKVLTSDPAILKSTDDILNKLASPVNQGSAT